MTVTFRINDIIILIMEIDTKTKSATPSFVGDTTAVNSIIRESERNYSGLASRLRYMMNLDKRLPELLEIIKQDGATISSQHNLKIEVT